MATTTNAPVTGTPTTTGAGYYRWVICALLFIAATINYVDRQVIGLLKPTLQQQFGWSEIDYSNIVFAFQLAYAIGLLVAGRIIDRIGTKAGFSIAILLWIVLRRFGDVLLTLVPLLLAGMVTLEVCVLIGMPLNFANIIALPLLLGVGVAFKIYYIMAWRSGHTNLLQSSLTRAVIWSALTTATAFGSLWLSQHPGTSSMGKLLALSLVTTLAAAVLFQPALMGKPRGAGDP